MFFRAELINVLMTRRIEQIERKHSRYTGTRLSQMLIVLNCSPYPPVHFMMNMALGRVRNGRLTVFGSILD